MKTMLRIRLILIAVPSIWIAGFAGMRGQSLSSASPDSQSASSSRIQSAPPVAPVRPVIDDYYGTKIVDNYRYMENLKDPEVQEWFKIQNDYSRASPTSKSSTTRRTQAIWSCPSRQPFTQAAAADRRHC